MSKLLDIALGVFAASGTVGAVVQSQKARKLAEDNGNLRGELKALQAKLDSSSQKLAEAEQNLANLKALNSSLEKSQVGAQRAVDVTFDKINEVNPNAILQLYAREALLVLSYGATSYEGRIQYVEGKGWTANIPNNISCPYHRSMARFCVDNTRPKTKTVPASKNLGSYKQISRAYENTYPALGAGYFTELKNHIRDGEVIYVSPFDGSCRSLRLGISLGDAIVDHADYTQINRLNVSFNQAGVMILTAYDYAVPGMCKFPEKANIDIGDRRSGVNYMNGYNVEDLTGSVDVFLKRYAKARQDERFLNTMTSWIHAIAIHRVGDCIRCSIVPQLSPAPFPVSFFINGANANYFLETCWRWNILEPDSPWKTLEAWSNNYQQNDKQTVQEYARTPKFQKIETLNGTQLQYAGYAFTGFVFDEKRQVNTGDYRLQSAAGRAIERGEYTTIVVPIGTKTTYTLINGRQSEMESEFGIYALNQTTEGHIYMTMMTNYKGDSREGSYSLYPLDHVMYKTDGGGATGRPAVTTKTQAVHRGDALRWLIAMMLMKSSEASHLMQDTSRRKKAESFITDYQLFRAKHTDVPVGVGGHGNRPVEWDTCVVLQTHQFTLQP